MKGVSQYFSVVEMVRHPSGMMSITAFNGIPSPQITKLKILNIIYSFIFINDTTKI